MIPIFDLDDTLYPERSYVESGFRAVASWGEKQFRWPASDSFKCMRELLVSYGRGRVFDLWFEQKGERPTRSLVRAALRIYRHHNPDIALPESHRALLESLGKRGQLYLVTDGHKIVQSKKVNALGLASLFTGIYITHRYGRTAAKPSARCFDLIRKRENVSWGDIVYVGDNPAKDFITINKLGGTTIRVLTGNHANDPACPGFDASRRVKCLTEIEPILDECFTELNSNHPLIGSSAAEVSGN